MRLFQFFLLCVFVFLSVLLGCCSANLLDMARSRRIVACFDPLVQGQTELRSKVGHPFSSNEVPRGRVGYLWPVEVRSLCFI